MFECIIQFAIEQRWLIILVVLGMAALGVYNYGKLPIGAVPDIINVQVQINTVALGYSPLETEQRITYPIETVMVGLPGLEQTRSLSRYGLSQMTVTFKDDTDIYFARQLVSQRIQEARERPSSGVTPAMGLISTGSGETYLWTVEAEDGARKPDGAAYMPTDLREIQDWVVKSQLRNVAGVTEINSTGGYVKEYLVASNLERLASYGLTLTDLVSALDKNNNNVGAGYIERRGEQYLACVSGQIKSPSDIRNVIMGTTQGQPIHIRDAADVDIGRELHTSAATENGKEAVPGIVFVLIGENSRAVSQAVDEKMTEVSRTFPAGVKAVTVYDRTVLVDKAIVTVRKDLLEDATLVIAILFPLLGNIRVAVVMAIVIPLVMLFTLTGMVSYKINANLMSLGTLDFGIIIDGAVVIVENCVRRLAHVQKHHKRELIRSERSHEMSAAVREARRSLLSGQLIIMIVYLPIFALTRVEGKMFHPMMSTVVLALFAATVLSMTFVPAAVALFIGRKMAEEENRLMEWAKRHYQPMLEASLVNTPVALIFACIAIVFCPAVASRLGSEFVLNLNEGGIMIQSLRTPGTSLSQSSEMQKQVESTLKAKFPEIERIFARTGAAEIASDPMPLNVSDGYIMFKPQTQWPKPKKTKEELLSVIQAEAEGIPGNNYEFLQPIQLRSNELISGVRSDVAIKIPGDDNDVLNEIAGKVATVLQGIQSVTEAKTEQTTGLPMLPVNTDRQKAARCGLDMSDMQNAVAIAVDGKEVGTFFQGNRRFCTLVRLPDAVRGDLEALRRLPMSLPKNGAGESKTTYTPLSEAASLDLVPGSNQVSRENSKCRIVISADVRGRNIGPPVPEAEAVIERQVKIPTGYWITWGGTLEQLQLAATRLQIVVPTVLLLVFVLLSTMFNNVKDGLLVLTDTPFVLTGGVLALWLRGIPLSISAAVSFITLSGVAALDGPAILSFIRPLREEGRSLDTATRTGTLTRLRSVLMTALVASLGLVPMIIATGMGAEVQRPPATVVIGGILSSTALTPLVLPVLYRLAHRKDEAEDMERAGETAPWSA